MSSAERKEVLELLATGNITASEAAALLSSGERKGGEESYPDSETIKLTEDEIANGKDEKPVAKPPTWLHVKVSDLASGKDKVTVNIPLRLVKYGMSLGRRFAPELDELDPELLSENLWTQSGTLVDVRDDEDGERVLILVD